jgi:hypothetical protein
MAVSWTPEGKTYKEASPTTLYRIRDISGPCPTCSGTCRVGEKVPTWTCCPGFPDDVGDWYSCPYEEAQESGPIVHRFELEGGGEFEACLHCGPKHYEKVILREKVEARMVGQEFCPDCSKFGFSMGKISKFELSLKGSAGFLVLATASSETELQMACLGFVLTRS